MYLDFNDPSDLQALATATVLAIYDEAPAMTLAPVGFRMEATGRVQLARTGSGFWRADHGAPFAIDKKLLTTIVRNTQIRSRPLRGDYMHWSNQDREDPDQYRPAGYIDPRQLVIEPWRAPEGDREWGIFGPAVWTPEAKCLLDAGLNQISPVIDWAHRLRWDTPEAPAGTLLGPTITKWALVDEGFFWMDPARYYSQNPGAEGLLYSEVTMLSVDELLALITALRKAGTQDPQIIELVKAMMSNAPPTAPDATVPGADATAAPGMTQMTQPGAGAAPITMASRLYQLFAANRQNPGATTPPAAAPQPAQSALLTALMGVIKPATPTAPAATPTATRPAAAAPTPTSSPASFSLADITGAVQASLAPIVRRLDALEVDNQVSTFAANDASGLHAGLDQETAARMFAVDPQGYQAFIGKRQALAGNPPAASTPGASPLTRLFNQNNGVATDDRQVLANTAIAYQNDPKNVVNGKKPSYDVSLAYAIGVQTNARRARGEAA